ncbi:MAG: tRNA uridine-5-carboxymethylaminomethyl(34) synthesis GTPase MnmE [Parvularculaceae bacterium]
MPTPTPDTIFARASGAGKAGVAVYRLSGPFSWRIGALLSKRSVTDRAPKLAKVFDPGTAEAIDEGLILAFKGPASFTGEDVVEFHLHGSRAVEAAFGAAALKAGARLAEPGEFTRRAFLNGKIDLAQVEALSDLIDAETSSQRRQALGQFGGRLSDLAEGWRGQLISIMAALEADIDFPDEEGVPAAVAAQAGPKIEALAADLREHVTKSSGARRLREGVEAVIIGAPNAGKSSLLNALAGADVAIVSSIAGTTRDVIETRLDLGGVAVLIADTAGLGGPTADPIEREGARRARARAETADVRIMVIDPLAEELAPSGGTAGRGDVAEVQSVAAMLRPGDFLLYSKRDLGGAPAPAPDGVARFHVSAKTSAGMPEFLAALESRARDLAGGSEGAAFTRLRHVEAGKRALAALDRARERLPTAAELAAEDVRLAARALMSITGAVDVEDVLAEIFASFCIGK